MMRPLEVTLPIALSTYIFVRPSVHPLADVLLAILIGIHFVVEKFRWQMIPLYALTPALMVVGSFNFFPASALVSFLTLGLVALSIALPALLPVPRIVPPSGPHRVGTRHFMLVDSSRREIYSDSDEPRRVMVQVWYPASLASTDKIAPWMPNAELYAKYCARFIGRADFFLSHLQLLKSPAYLDAAIEGDSFAVLLFSHGWMGYRAQNTTHSVMLASQGYIVIALEHPYASMVTVFPDGSIADNNPNAMPDEKLSYEEFESSARKLGEQWAQDLTFVLNQFTDPTSKAGKIFSDHLKGEVGAFGHSTGAGAAIQFAAQDSRCKSVLGMDPFVRPVSTDVIKNGISRPSLFIFSEAWASDLQSRNSILFHSLFEKISNEKYAVSLSGTKHYDFTDVPLLSPIAPWLGIKGPLNGKRVVEITNAYLLDFFDHTLKGSGSQIFEETQWFKEVQPLYAQA